MLSRIGRFIDQRFTEIERDARIIHGAIIIGYMVVTIMAIGFMLAARSFCHEPVSGFAKYMERGE